MKFRVLGGFFKREGQRKRLFSPKKHDFGFKKHKFYFKKVGIYAFWANLADRRHASREETSPSLSLKIRKNLNNIRENS